MKNHRFTLDTAAQRAVREHTHFIDTDEAPDDEVVAAIGRSLGMGYLRSLDATQIASTDGAYNYFDAVSEPWDVFDQMDLHERALSRSIAARVVEQTMGETYDERAENTRQYVWAAWTVHGAGLSEDAREQTRKSASDAVANSYHPGMTDVEWGHAALKLLGT